MSLTPEKENIVKKYPFYTDYISGKINQKTAIENLNQFKKQLLNDGLTELDLFDVRMFFEKDSKKKSTKLPDTMAVVTLPLIFGLFNEMINGSFTLWQFLKSRGVTTASNSAVGWWYARKKDEVMKKLISQNDTPSIKAFKLYIINVVLFNIVFIPLYFFTLTIFVADISEQVIRPVMGLILFSPFLGPILHYYITLWRWIFTLFKK